MTHRERLNAVLRHGIPDRVPMDLGGTANSAISSRAYENLKRYLGFDALPETFLNKALATVMLNDEVLERLDIDTRGLWTGADDSGKIKNLAPDRYIDEWGVERYQASGSPYFEAVNAPFYEGLDLRRLDAFDWPSPQNPGRIKGMTERWQALKQTDYATVLHVRGGFITEAQYLRSLQGFLEDLYLEPELLCELMDHTLEYQCGLLRRALAACHYDVDVVHFGDDLGMQTALMMSPAKYRELIKPRQAKLFGIVKELSGAKILLHSCGSNFDIMEDYIEIGVSAYNPVQTRAAKMAPEHLKKHFKGRMVFWGGVDTSTVLNCGTPADVEKEVRHLIETLGEGGGYVLNAVHNIQDDVPPANIVAMFEAGLKYGGY